MVSCPRWVGGLRHPVEGYPWGVLRFSNNLHRPKQSHCRRCPPTAIDKLVLGHNKNDRSIFPKCLTYITVGLQEEVLVILEIVFSHGSCLSWTIAAEPRIGRNKKMWGIKKVQKKEDSGGGDGSPWCRYERSSSGCYALDGRFQARSVTVDSPEPRIPDTQCEMGLGWKKKEKRKEGLDTQEQDMYDDMTVKKKKESKEHRVAFVRGRALDALKYLSLFCSCSLALSPIPD